MAAELLDRTVRYFVYCSRCRRVLNLDQAIPCPQTDRWMCKGCADVKVQA